MEASSTRLMKASEIPAFVTEVIKAGCDICAVGHDSYELGDADLSASELESVLPELQRIEEPTAIAISSSWRSSPICTRLADIWISVRQRRTGRQLGLPAYFKAGGKNIKINVRKLAEEARLHLDFALGQMRRFHLNTVFEFERARD